MAQPVRKISDEDLNKLIERAYLLTNQEHVRTDAREHDFEAIKKIAAQAGIPPEHLEEAYRQLLEEQQAEQMRAVQKAARRKKIAAVLGISVITAAVAAWFFRPRTFEGTLQTAIALALDSATHMPLHKADTVRVTEKAFFVHALIGGDFGEQVTWELIPPHGEAPPPDGAIVYVQNKKGITAYQRFSLAPDAPLGEWKAVLKIFDKPAAEHRFTVAKGIIKMHVDFTNQAGSAKNITRFRALTDTTVICRVGLQNLIPGESVQVVWQYYDPSGNLAHTDRLTIKPNNSAYFAQSTMTIDLHTVKTGKWTVKVRVNDETESQGVFHMEVGDADVALTPRIANDRPAGRVSVFGTPSDVYGYVYFPKINRQHIVLSWKIKDAQGNVVRAIEQPLSNRVGTDWWAYRKLLNTKEMPPGRYTMELWSGNLLISKINFEITK